MSPLRELCCDVVKQLQEIFWIQKKKFLNSGSVCWQPVLRYILVLKKFRVWLTWYWFETFYESMLQSYGSVLYRGQKISPSGFLPLSGLRVGSEVCWNQPGRRPYGLDTSLIPWRSMHRGDGGIDRLFLHFSDVPFRIYVVKEFLFSSWQSMSALTEEK